MATTGLTGWLARISTNWNAKKVNQTPSGETSDVASRKGSEDITSASNNVWSYYEDNSYLENTRIGKYNEYDEMDSEDSVIISALDIYADNATQGDQGDARMTFICEDAKALDVLNRYKSKLDIENIIWAQARDLAKYGDLFEEVVVYPGGEVQRLKGLPCKDMRVITDKYGRLDPDMPYGQMDAQTMNMDVRFADWQVLHFKIGRSRTSAYGVSGSVLYPVRKVYKQLNMMEDSMVVARLLRATMRYAFLVDVEGIPPGEDTLSYLNEVKTALKKRRIVNPATGKIDASYNPMSIEEDIFIGTKNGSKADVKVLQGSANMGTIGDVEYFQRKEFAGLKVPKAYMGIEGDVNSKATLTEQDVQFSRVSRRIQCALITGYKKLFDYVLMVNGLDPKKIKYQIVLPAISTIDEQRQWQVNKLKAQVADLLHEKMGVTIEWLLKNIMDYSDADIALILKQATSGDSFDSKLFKVKMDQDTQKADIDAKASINKAGSSGLANARSLSIVGTKGAKNPKSTQNVPNVATTTKKYEGNITVEGLEMAKEIFDDYLETVKSLVLAEE